MIQTTELHTFYAGLYVKETQLQSSVVFKKCLFRKSVLSIDSQTAEWNWTKFGMELSCLPGNVVNKSSLTSDITTKHS